MELRSYGSIWIIELKNWRDKHLKNYRLFSKISEE